MTSNCKPFPPTNAAELLALCDGNWLSLRSRYKPDQGENSWQESEKAELHWQWQELEAGVNVLGVLQLKNPGPGLKSITFNADGNWQDDQGNQGVWQLQPEAQFKLEYQKDNIKVQETIWFRKPNLRLRSLLIWDGESLMASQFCSEIRRVIKPSN